jgi:hypothetical protein
VRFVVRFDLLIVTEIQIIVMILMRFHPGGREAEAGTGAGRCGLGPVGASVAHEKGPKVAQLSLRLQIACKSVMIASMLPTYIRIACATWIR